MERRGAVEAVPGLAGPKARGVRSTEARRRGSEKPPMERRGARASHRTHAAPHSAEIVGAPRGAPSPSINGGKRRRRTRRRKETGRRSVGFAGCLKSESAVVPGERVFAQGPGPIFRALSISFGVWVPAIGVRSTPFFERLCAGTTEILQSLFRLLCFARPTPARSKGRVYARLRRTMTPSRNDE
jgi:hypothetical protein